MGRLTTHVLDTARGRPGAGIGIDLFKIDGGRAHVKTLVTNADGRTDAPVLDEDEFSTGIFELVFVVDAYFSDADLALADPPFLDQVVLRFTMSSDTHYHVPLLVSPWSYSTYRGS